MVRLINDKRRLINNLRAEKQVLEIIKMF